MTRTRMKKKTRKTKNDLENKVESEIKERGETLSSLETLALDRDRRRSLFASGVMGKLPMDTSVVSELPPPPPQPVGIYGWRKRCVYAFLLALMAIIVINIALTIWILRVLNFSFSGIPGLRFDPKGLRLTDETEFSNTVYVEEIKSSKNKPLYIMSHKDVQLLQTDGLNQLRSRVVLGPKSVEATCDKFIVQDASGRVTVKVEGDTIHLGTKDASYPGDIEFTSSVSTPTIRSPAKQDLRVESSNSKVHVTGMGGIAINSDAGDVTVSAQDHVFITSNGGAVHIQGTDVYVKDLPKAATLPSSFSSSSSSSFSSSSDTEIHQLCACANGKLFLAPAFGDCELDPSVCGQ